MSSLPKPRLDSWALGRLAAALVSFVPFAYGLAAGGAFYFRDLSTYFFPIRRFVVDGCSTARYDTGTRT